MSHASNEVVGEPIATSVLVKEAKHLLNELELNNAILMTWIPGHMRYKGNEKFDRLAKKEAESDEQPESNVGMPYQ